jgi:hypothetical protein
MLPQNMRQPPSGNTDVDTLGPEMVENKGGAVKRVHIMKVY